MTSSPGTHRANLRALLAAIKNSPIIARLTARLWPGRDWASVRRSPDVDAFVLAWIASHVRRPVRRRDFFMWTFVKSDFVDLPKLISRFAVALSIGLGWRAQSSSSVWSMARLAPATLSASQAAIAILAAVASNTVSEVAIGAAIGRGAFAVEIAAMAAECIVVGGLVARWTFAILAM